MPLYEYQCEDCDQRFERIQKFSDDLVSNCPSCNGKVNKLFSSPAIQFKGTGWYITDYARKPSGDQAMSSESKAEAKNKQPSNKKETASDKKPSSPTTTK